MIHERVELSVQETRVEVRGRESPQKNDDSSLYVPLTAAGGATLGFIVGGPVGALIGAALFGGAAAKCEAEGRRWA